jgi:formylglycine-generating enzyme required for sulfatase activity
VYKNGSDVYRSGAILDPQVVTSANGYRLPTEAEWEFAARGGTQSNGYTYSGGNDFDAVGWFYENAGLAVHEVSKKQANELGIYDMSGNLWEWSGSWYPGSEGSARVIRGGGWGDTTETGTFAYRYGDSPEVRDLSFGFRVALSAAP